MKINLTILCLYIVVAGGCSGGKSARIPSPSAGPTAEISSPSREEPPTRPAAVDTAESMFAAGAYARAAVLYRRAAHAAPRHPQAPEWYLQAGKAMLQHAAVRRRISDRRDACYEAALHLARAGIHYPHGGEATAEAMFLAGQAYIRAGQNLEAYGVWQGLTSSRPDSEWSKPARRGMADLQLTTIQKRTARRSYEVPERPAAKARTAPTDKPEMDQDVKQYLGDLQDMPADQAFQMSAQLFLRAAELSDDPDKRRRFTLLAGLATIKQAQATAADTKRHQLLSRAADNLLAIANRYKDHDETAAEALYWASHCHAERGERQAAYRLTKRLVWDYPESKWAEPGRALSRKQLLLILQELEHEQTKSSR